MRRQLIIVFLIACPCLFAACSDDPEALAPPAPPVPPEEKLVRGTFRSIPDLAVYREVTETEWKPLPMITPTTFQFSPKAPYLVTVVCVQGNESYQSVSVQQLAQTPDDPGDLDVRCDREGPHHVTGSFVIGPGGLYTDGWISMSRLQNRARADFEFLLERGTYDFLAYVHGRFATRRGIEVSGDLSMPPLDLDLELESTAAITPAFSVSNLAPMEQITWVVVELTTRDGWLNFHYGNNLVGPIPVAPDRALLPSDVQTMMVHARSGQSFRGVRRKFREGDSPALTFPDHVDSVTLSQADGRPMATWAALPDHDRIQAQFYGRTADPWTTIYNVMTLSRSFEDAMGVSSLALDAAIPGYQPRWLIDVSKMYTQYLYAERDVGNDTLMSGAVKSVNVPAMSAGSPDLQPHDLHRHARALHAPAP